MKQRKPAPTKSRRKATKPAKRRARATPRRHVKLSPCALHYAMAIANPFHPKSVGACIPTFPSRPSQKVSAKISGTFATGGYGMGFVALAPTVVTDNASVYSTISSYGGTTVACSFAAPAVGVVPRGFGNLPYTAAQVNDGNSQVSSTVAGRVISASIRVRYTGTELSRGGTVYALCLPDHQSVNGLTIDDLSSFKECIKVPVTKKWTELVASAIDNDELDYPESAVYNTNGNLCAILSKFPFSAGQALGGSGVDTSIGAPVMVIAATGPIANSFEYEIIQHVEYIGKPTQPFVTRSHADAEGVSIVTEAAGNVNATRNSTGMSQGLAFAQEIATAYRNNKAPIDFVVGMFGDQIGINMREFL